MQKLPTKLAALALAASAFGLTQVASAGDRLTVIYSNGSYYGVPRTHHHRDADYRYHRYDRHHCDHEHRHYLLSRKYRGHDRRHGYDRGYERHGRHHDADKHGERRADRHGHAGRRDRNDHRVNHTAHVSRDLF
ncbi:MAG: hypothetical protein PVJ83_04510 [Gammaproteobacteria bacterium]